MVHGYHVVLTAYGFWLPNDPRGSWSDFIGKWELVRYGKPRRATERRRLSDLSEAELKLRDAARAALKYPPVEFSGTQALSIANGFASACCRSGYTIWACSILPEHTHLVIARHRYKIEQVANLLKGEATRQIIRDGLHPLAHYTGPGERPPRMWAEHQWNGFLNCESEIDDAIAYVEGNPQKERKPAQSWSFVSPFSGLPKGWVTYH